MRDDRPDVEWLEDDVSAGPDEDLPQPAVRPPRQRRAIVVAAAIVAVGIAVVVIVSGTRGGDGQRRGGPVIPAFTPGNGTGHLPVPGTSIAIIERPADGADVAAFDPRTGRANSDFPAQRCASGCDVALDAPARVRAALLARYPDVEAIVVQTVTDSDGFIARTIRARDGDREIRAYVLPTRRTGPDVVRRLGVRGRAVVQAVVRRSGLQIAVSVDRPSGSIDTTAVESLAHDRRLLSRR